MIPARRDSHLTPAAGAPELRPLTPREFKLIHALVLREAGIFLSEGKQALVVGRLAKRLRTLGLTCFSDYHARVEEDPEERARMLDCLCTNETHFFREPEHWAFLEQRAFPELRARAEAGQRARRVRIWSAACSTGEEPYSLAMAALDQLPGWSIEIVATDLSNKALELARAGLWRIGKAEEIPTRYLKAFMLRGTGGQEGWMKAGPEIRAVVQFSRYNLNTPSMEPMGRFDLVFCRNVLIYFSAEMRTRVLRQLVGQLAPEGYLFLGHAETLTGAGDLARQVIPTVYRSEAESASPRSRLARSA